MQTQQVSHNYNVIVTNSNLRVPTIIWKSPAGALFARSESFSNTNVLFRKRRNIEDPGIIRLYNVIITLF